MIDPAFSESHWNNDIYGGNEPGMDFLKKDYREVLKKSEEKSKQKRGM